MKPCDKEMVGRFDYSTLGPEFARLSKPAKRALINNGIRSARDLASWSQRDVMQLHGIGPSALPILEDALQASGLGFAG